MKTIEKINIAILGCADIAQRAVLPEILQLSDYYNISGIASRTEAKGIQCAKKFSIDYIKSYKDLIESLPDAVYIPLPNSLHAQWIENALNNNIHVLVEKPLACNYSDVFRLNNLAKKNNLALVENFQFRFHSQLEYILNIIKSGEIGDLRSINSSFGFPPFQSNNNIRYQSALGGGSLLDIGSYPLKISQIILGSKIKIVGACLHFDSIKGVDTWGGAIVKQINGDLFGNLSFGFDNYYQCSIELWGSKGRLTTNRIFTAPSDLQPKINIENIDGVRTEIIEPDNHFKNMLLHFYKVVKNNKKKDEEYKQNINQSRLLSEFLDYAK
jgi:dTDP-3,4-didehydro-2,6-dideoxy-alpha-D-glucose 3-reductase